MQRVLAIELAASIRELTHIRWAAHRAVLGVRPIQAPLVGFRIIKAERQTFDASARATHFELLQLSASVPNLSRHRWAVEHHPGVEPSQRMQQPLQMYLAGAQLE